jgi:hypothetical protein
MNRRWPRQRQASIDGTPTRAMAPVCLMENLAAEAGPEHLSSNKKVTAMNLAPSAPNPAK